MCGQLPEFQHLHLMTDCRQVLQAAGGAAGEGSPFLLLSVSLMCDGADRVQLPWWPEEQQTHSRPVLTGELPDSSAFIP